MTSSNGNIFRDTGPLCGELMFSLICAWLNGRVNNREAGDLRRRRAYHNVIVMEMIRCHFTCPSIYIYISFIWTNTMVSRERMVSQITHGQLDSLFNSAFMLTTKDWLSVLGICRQLLASLYKELVLQRAFHIMTSLYNETTDIIGIPQAIFRGITVT